MQHWIRFEHLGKTRFGTLSDKSITPYEGDMFDSPKAMNESISLGEVSVLTPSQPSKLVAMWNNFHALAAKLEIAVPKEPLYFLKGPNSFLAHGQKIKAPVSYDGKVVFEGELGIVIGKSCSQVSEADADEYIFGYTCINDVTAIGLIKKDPAFEQWARAKSFDTFGVFGPVIASALNPDDLSIRTILNDQERQNYPVSDMVFQPRQLVSLLSQDMSLSPGDVIACGTSVGVGSMKPGSKIEIVIDGIGTLSNEYM